MKKIKLLCLVLLPLLFAWSCKNESGMPAGNWGFVVSIEGSKQGDSLSVEYGAGQITDTVIKLTSDNQKVEFSVPFITPTLVSILYMPEKEGSEPTYVEFFVDREGEMISITGKADKFLESEISGGLYSRHEFDTIRALSKEFFALMDDSVQVTKCVEKMAGFHNRYFNSLLDYIKTNPDNAYSAFLLTDLVEMLPLADIAEIFNGFSDRVKNSEYGKMISRHINAASNMTGEGSNAPDFTLNTLDGKQISLSAMRGKWVLLDFWGSWCAPCRKGNPHLVELYKKYSAKGIEFIGLGVSDTDERLREAIKEDGLLWPNANTSQSEEGRELPSVYQVRGVPTKILINPQGIIEYVETGYDPSADQLGEKLAAVFGK